MTSLPPIRTVLAAGKKNAPAETLAVKLHARLTEIGTLELWCSEADGPRTWKLQFDVRSATQTDRAGHAGIGEQAGFVDESLAADVPGADRCRPSLPDWRGQLLQKVSSSAWSRRPTCAAPPGRRRCCGPCGRCSWRPRPARRRSAEHEARWLYLMGYRLRPGYGMAVDDWRVAQTWRLLQGKLLHGTPTCRVEWFILWRRIAGGLSAGQQRALAEPLLANLPSLFSVKGSRKGTGSRRSRAVRSAAAARVACEWLPTETKEHLGDTLIARIPREKTQAVQEAQLWTLARLGARVPMYGPLNAAVPVEKVESWIAPLLAIRETSDWTSICADATGPPHRRPLPGRWPHACAMRFSIGSLPSRIAVALDRASPRRGSVTGGGRRPDVRREFASGIANCAKSLSAHLAASLATRSVFLCSLLLT